MNYIYYQTYDNKAVIYLLMVQSRELLWDTPASFLSQLNEARSVSKYTLRGTQYEFTVIREDVGV